MKLDQKTTEELLHMRKAIENDPANKAEGFYLYTAKARKKFENLQRRAARMGEAGNKKENQ